MRVSYTLAVEWSRRDGCRSLQKAAVRNASRSCGKPLVCHRESNVSLPRTHGSLGPRPVDHVALRLAPTHLPQLETGWEQMLHSLRIGAVVVGHQPLNDR